MEQNTPKISVVIPVYFNSDEIYTLLEECVASLRGYDELILQIDRTGEGFAKTVNKGIKRATGDFIAIVNDDTRLLNGTVREMCRTNAVVRPKLVGGELAKFAFAVIDRKVFEKVGVFDEDFEIGFYEDDDFLDRCVLEGVDLVESPFMVWHYGGATISKRMTPEIEAKNKELYENKRKERQETSQERIR